MTITGSPSAIPETDKTALPGQPGRESARFWPEADIDGGTAGSTARWTLAGFPSAIVFARADGAAAWDRRLAMGDALDITIRRERGVVIAAVTGGVDISPWPCCGNACSSWLTVAGR